jgi:hypothetical protein
VGGLCSTLVGNEECTQNFDRKTSGRRHLVNTGVSVRLMLNWVFGWSWSTSRRIRCIGRPS